MALRKAYTDETLDRRALEDMRAAERLRIERAERRKQPKIARTAFPAGARSVSRVAGKPVWTKRALVNRREHAMVLQALEFNPQAEVTDLARKFSESEGKYERRIVRQAEAACERKIKEELQNMSIQFRAVLIDPGAMHERPQQIFGTSRESTDAWAATVLGKAVSKAARVEVYETVERLSATISKPEPEGATGLLITPEPK